MKLDIIKNFCIQCDDEELIFIIVALKTYLDSDDVKKNVTLKCRIDYYINLLEKLRK